MCKKPILFDLTILQLLIIRIQLTRHKKIRLRQLTNYHISSIVQNPMIFMINMLTPLTGIASQFEKNDDTLLCGKFFARTTFLSTFYFASFT